MDKLIEELMETHSELDFTRELKWFELSDESAELFLSITLDIKKLIERLEDEK